MAHLFLSAAHKSSGKTTITLGLLELFRRRGLKVSPCKKGPDYIDPIWHSMASGLSCINLDTFISSEEEVIEDFCAVDKASDLTLIEGNKGLFDGVALDGSNSNAAVAKLLKAPVILIIDCRGMTRGIAPLLLGYTLFDQDVHIAGVILNRVGGARHESKLRASVEHFTKLPVLGAVYENSALGIDEEHLGLVPGNEHNHAKDVITTIADTLATSVDLDKIMAIAHNARSPISTPTLRTDAKQRNRFNGLRIAIARDEAFGFYYPGDLKKFREYGAELVEFSPLRDQSLPSKIDGLFFGGGFPERFASQLSQNLHLLQDIRQSVNNGLPTYAECGGMMYLSRSIQWKGKTYPVVGVIPAEAVMHKKPQGRGYVKLEASEHRLWPESLKQQAVINAHEFHYSCLENLPASTLFAYEMKRGTGVSDKKDGIVLGNLMASYTHMRHTNANPWVRNFLGFVKKQVENNKVKGFRENSEQWHQAINQ